MKARRRGVWSCDVTEDEIGDEDEIGEGGRGGEEEEEEETQKERK